MVRRIAIIQGHPDPEGGHFCHALASAYRTGAEEAGHSVDIVETGRLELPYLRNKAQWETPPEDEGVLRMQRIVGTADQTPRDPLSAVAGRHAGGPEIRARTPVPRRLRHGGG